MESVITALPEGDQPIRAEVFGIERLEQHAHTLAQAQGITEKPTKGHELLPRVRDNWRALLASYRHIVAALRGKREITQAELSLSAWLMWSTARGLTARVTRC